MRTAHRTSGTRERLPVAGNRHEVADHLQSAERGDAGAARSESSPSWPASPRVRRARNFLGDFTDNRTRVPVRRNGGGGVPPPSRRARLTSLTAPRSTSTARTFPPAGAARTEERLGLLTPRAAWKTEPPLRRVWLAVSHHNRATNVTGSALSGALVAGLGSAHGPCAGALTCAPTHPPPEANRAPQRHT
jgi:hypothetical protein